jgi:hypothetical protein
MTARRIDDHVPASPAVREVRARVVDHPRDLDLILDGLERTAQRASV